MEVAVEREREEVVAEPGLAARDDVEILADRRRLDVGADQELIRIAAYTAPDSDRGLGRKRGSASARRMRYGSRKSLCGMVGSPARVPRVSGVLRSPRSADA
jgi:hypothetical protein